SFRDGSPFSLSSAHRIQRILKTYFQVAPFPPCSLDTPALTPAETAPCATRTASARTMSAILTPTITLLKPTVAPFGTMMRSVQDVAMSGAANASGPPFTVTFGLPIAADP